MCCSLRSVVQPGVWQVDIPVCHVVVFMLLYTTSERVVNSCLFDLLSESYFLLDNTAVSVADTRGRLRNTFDNLPRNDYIYKM